MAFEYSTLVLLLVAPGAQVSSVMAQSLDSRALGRSTSESSPSWSCRPTGPPRFLPPAAREASGLARSLDRPGVLWTHNDRGNGPDLFAVDENGQLVQSVRVPVPAVYWEDIELASREPGSCLYVGDTGDNDA